MQAVISRMSEFVVGGADKARAATGWRRWLIAFLAGVCGALAMAPVYALPLLAVSLTVFVLLIDGAKTHARPRASAFAAGWFWGFGYFLAGVYWMALSFFVQAELFAWMAPFAMMGMPAFLALFTGFAALVCVPFDRTGWARVAIFAAVFAMVEYLRGHILTGLPWNLTSQAFAGSAAGAQTAAWYGAYGLSLVAIFLAMAPAAGLRAEDRPHPLSGAAVALGGTALLFVIGFISLGVAQTPPAPKAYVRIVQP
ncbi:MAG: apolipoprotein N-acyltransferase, partial [Oricola sp.]|nr:apolipoprotein N-acyltransferase [Oricola sp.]